MFTKTWTWITAKKNEIKKKMNCTGFLMIAIITLYDEYVDWPKLTEQKTYNAPPPPPLNWLGTINICDSFPDKICTCLPNEPPLSRWSISFQLQLRQMWD